MKKITLLLLVIATLAGVVVFTVTTSRHVTAQEPTPIFVKKIPPGYRDWKVVSVAHEAGELNDIRAVLGNDIAIKAYREGKLPFPEGAIVGRIAWAFVPSEENNKTFGREQLCTKSRNRALKARNIKARGKREAKRSASPLVRENNLVQR